MVLVSLILVVFFGCATSKLLPGVRISLQQLDNNSVYLPNIGQFLVDALLF